jgi:putative tryptophan/tyrosine transport system substrate-binding protein
MSTFAEGQQAGRVPVIGILSPSSAGLRDSYFHFVEALRQGLHDLGYAEGKNILVEYRYAEGNLDRMPSLVAEFVQLKPTVIMVSAIPAIRAAKEMTKNDPHRHNYYRGPGCHGNCG